MTRASGFTSPKILPYMGLALALACGPEQDTATPTIAYEAGDTITTPSVIPELPIEVETEVGPAGSLKIIPLWKETIELIENPHGYVCPFPDDPATQSDERVECFATTDRRPFFESYFLLGGAVNPTRGDEVDTMPPLRVFDACHNVLTGQPLRMRPDEEIDWNQPGYLFDPDEVVAVTPPSQTGGIDSNIPIQLRTPIGALVSCSTDDPPEPIEFGFRLADPCEDVPPGSLVVSNPNTRFVRGMLGYSSTCLGPGPNNGCADPRIPPHRTVIAEAACEDGFMIAEDEDTGEVEVVEELEQPVNETHFISNRLAAEVLGKSLFWDMQVGSDGVQACGSCHAFAGVDHRTRNQLNPNALGGDLVLHLRGTTVQDTNAIDVVASDFPFHKKVDPDLPSDVIEATNCGHADLPPCGAGNVLSDSNDVLSSMGVSEFKQFNDVIVGAAGFGPGSPIGGVLPLQSDDGTAMPDPIAVMQGNRRIEPRHTPTMHAAAFNFDNFWDGRARHDFNGGSVFGPSDPFFHIHVNCEDGLRELAAPDEAELEDPVEGLCEWTELGGNYLGVDEDEEPVPVRIRFSSLASQSVGPPLSDFEMAFGFADPNLTDGDPTTGVGRNWQKIGKKLLQDGVTPLAKQLVDVTDSRIGPWSNQGGSECIALGRPTAIGKPGLCTTYTELIEAAFTDELWNNADQHLAGTVVPMNNDCDPGEQIHELDMTATCDPFDGYVIETAEAAADPANTNQFTQMEANFSLFFGLSVQAYEQLLIPDETPWDKFNDLYPMLGNGVAQPGEQATLPVGEIRELVTGSPTGSLDVNLVDGIDEDVIFGFDIFAGGNLTAALPVGPRNPAAGPSFPLGVGSNPFLRTARCMLCHLGPEQSDHTNNVNAGLLQGGTEQEFPFPQGAAEPTGVLRLVTGFSLAEELEENAQDGVEVENRNFNIFGNDLTLPAGCVPELGFPNGTDCMAPENAQIARSSATAFQDNGIYNIGLRPTNDDILRGGNDPFGFPLALSALALANLGGEIAPGVFFEPCDTETEAIADPASCNLPNFEPDPTNVNALTGLMGGVGGGLYETVGDCPGCDFEGTGYFQESINPGLQLEPAEPQLPEYLAEWANNLPAGEANPLIDELAFAPNTITETPAAEFGEILFGADVHCGRFIPAAFGTGPPSFGWGAVDANGNPVVSQSGASICPNSQTGVPPNMGLGDGPYVPGSLVAPPNGTWGTTPFANRVARDGAAKVPHLRNVELTGPYFHTGSYLTLRQVVDFYIRGGDFPVTNQEDRDPNLVNVDVQAFGYGSTVELNQLFLDGIPDGPSQYGSMPDTSPPGCIPAPGFPNGPNCTPEPATTTPEEAEVSIVKFLIALTDERVAFRSAPFDQPEIFVPIDGQAPQIDFGRAQLEALAGVPCAPMAASPVCFEQIPQTGREGQLTRVPNFLGISSTPVGGPNNDHFDR